MRKTNLLTRLSVFDIFWAARQALHRAPAAEMLERLLTCAVCNGRTEVPTSVLHCHHTFCARCIASWRLSFTKCPTCQGDIVATRCAVSESTQRCWNRAAYFAQSDESSRPLPVPLLPPLPPPLQLQFGAAPDESGVRAEQ
eukprot:420667-Prorocentrum_minimum.AAC.1